jgi:hypothetical protein
MGVSNNYSEYIKQFYIKKIANKVEKQIFGLFFMKGWDYD